MTFPLQPDRRHASAHAVRIFDSYFVAKSEHSLDRWNDHFDPHNTVYAGATLGWLYPHRSALRDAVAELVPNWGTGISYATRILGDEHGAVLAAALFEGITLHTQIPGVSRSPVTCGAPTGPGPMRRAHL
jgi:hypothetical protein